MVDRIILDGRTIVISHFEMDNTGGLRRIAAHFPVTSEDYHDVTTLLYKGEFDVQVPAQNAAFRGKIVEYSLLRIYIKADRSVPSNYPCWK